MVKLLNDWDNLLAAEFEKDYYKNLRAFLASEYRNKVIYPDKYDIFNALKLTSYEDTKVVIVGQDPYINKGEAHGLAFSVQPGVRVPPSLKNIFNEIETDLGVKTQDNGYLVNWSKQGVMLLNTVLTVEAKKSRSHAKKGWEPFTDAVMDILDKRDKPVVFMLWGKDAQAKGKIITNEKHLILNAAHPSPLAGGRFFGCKHFSKANEFLLRNNMEQINWGVSQ